MQKKYHFISGLPRSGSTLLTSLLIQNPRIHSNITDALCAFMMESINSLGQSRSNRVHVTEDMMRNVSLGIIDGYYKHINKEVIFNCNRAWVKYAEYLNGIFGKDFKMICMVRDYNLILNSFETLYKKRRLIDPIDTAPYSGRTTSVWHRTNFLATDGFLRENYNALKEAYYGPFRKNLLFVEFDDLVKTPVKALQRIYSFIDEPYFEHDFDNVSYSFEKYDDELNMPGLHTIRSKVEYRPPKIILPPDLMETYKNWEFWR